MPYVDRCLFQWLDGPLNRFSRSRHIWSRISQNRRVLGTKLGYYRTLTGNNTYHMEWYHVWWPWLTSKRVARFVSDSWVSCSISVRFFSCLVIDSTGFNGRQSGDVFKQTKITLFVVCWINSRLRRQEHVSSFSGGRVTSIWRLPVKSRGRRDRMWVVWQCLVVVGKARTAPAIDSLWLPCCCCCSRPVIIIIRWYERVFFCISIVLRTTSPRQRHWQPHGYLQVMYVLRVGNKLNTTKLSINRPSGAGIIFGLSIMSIPQCDNPLSGR